MEIKNFTDMATVFMFFSSALKIIKINSKIFCIYKYYYYICNIKHQTKI